MPPKSVTLRQPTPVMAGNLIELACTAEDSNPKTEIVWYRDNQPIREAGKSSLLQKKLLKEYEFLEKSSHLNLFLKYNEISLL